MKGYHARIEADAEGQVSLAWHTGQFAAIAQGGKLKPLKHYLRKPPRKQSSSEMLANMRVLAAHINRKASA